MFNLSNLFASRLVLPARACQALILCFCLAGCNVPPEQRAAEFVQSARENLESGDFDKARLDASNALQVQPKNAEARIILADIAAEFGDNQKVWEQLLLAVDSDPNVVEARIRLARLAFAAGFNDEAAAQIDALLALAPQNADVRVLKGLLDSTQGDTDGMLREMNAALSIDPANVDAAGYRAQILFTEGQTDKALDQIEELLEKPGLDQSDFKQLQQARLNMLDVVKRTDELEAALIRLIADDPEVLNWRLALSQFYESNGQTDEAENVLRRAVADFPESSAVRLSLTQYLYDARGLDLAVEYLKESIVRLPDAQTLRVALATLYEKAGNNTAAEAEYKALAELDPKSEEGYQARNWLARKRVLDGNIEQAQVLLGEILAENPGQADALYSRALLSFNDGLYDDALADLRVANRRDPDAVAINLLLARVYLQREDLVLAEDFYRRVLEVDQANADAKRELAVILSARGNLEESEQLLRENLSAEDDTALSRSNLVDVLIRQQNLDAAEAQVASLSAQGAIGATFSLGRVKEAQGEIDEAINAYVAAFEERPGNEALAVKSASSLLSVGRRDEAIEVYEKALAAKPDSLIIRNNYANLLLIRANDSAGHKRALALVEPLVGGDIAIESDPILLDTIGWAYYKNGDNKKAIRYLEMSTALVSIPEVHYHLGMAYQAVDDARARDQLQRALSASNPDFPGAEEARAVLDQLEVAGLSSGQS